MGLKARGLLNIGFKQGPVIGVLLKAEESAKTAGVGAETRKKIARELFSNPASLRSDAHFGEAASLWYNILHPEELYTFREDKPLAIWGKDFIDENTIDQMNRALSIPPAIRGALCADAHLGYGLPIGGVLAMDNAVMPYGVGVDIACRMMLSVVPIDTAGDPIKQQETVITKAIEKHTRFGLGAAFQRSGRRQHEVMDRDWSILDGIVDKDRAWNQLGSSGSGNHFLDVGEIEFTEQFGDVPPGKYVAILTHSGSRGLGSKVANHFTRVAGAKHPLLPPQYKRLAWLSMDDEDGIAYWKAMELAGEYASANHNLIHYHVLRELGWDALLQVENHHNFAWREEHDGRTVIVHRKGATPAGVDVLGVIPGSMATPGFLVRGKGNAASLSSASHGAGRAMSRTKTKEKYRWSDVREQLRHRNVKLISAGLDEVPGAYKDILKVMDAQTDLVDIIACFHPRLVKMSDDDTSED
jgi:tRNA-splicing ligase RtcB